jgi:uncharacterized membrane protein HdeD (DUF308 family)
MARIEGKGFLFSKTSRLGRSVCKEIKMKFMLRKVEGEAMEEKGKGNVKQLFSKFWWSFVIQGFVAVLFGLFVISWPGLSLDGLVLAFGFFAFLQGILSITPGLSDLGGRIYFLLIGGVVGILAGVLTFLGPGIGRMLWPEIATKTLLVIITLWAFLTGLSEVIGSFRLPAEIKEKWVITLSGIFCLLLGLILFFHSEAGAMGNASVIGLFGIVFGVLWLFVGFKVRKVYSRI